MEDYKLKKPNREKKVKARRNRMPINGLGYVRLVLQELGKKAKS
jgi:hypothetical protein